MAGQLKDHPLRGLMRCGRSWVIDSFRAKQHDEINL
jgi:hypothetical protein